MTLFDTAEVYGGGESERIIGALLADDPRRAGSVVLATKFMPSPWKLDVRGALLKSLRASLARLGLPAVDLYQIHGPISLRSHAALAEALAAAHRGGPGQGGRRLQLFGQGDPVHRGRACGHGICGWPPTRSSSRCSAGLRRPAACSPPAPSWASSPLAYSPIGQGRLTGKYSAANPPPGKRNFSNHPMEVVDGVVADLRRIGEKYGGKLPSQVALNWVMAKGAVPIPGAKNRGQAEENAGALGWSIDEDDLARLDRAALPGIRSLQGRFWQHG